MLGSMHWFDVCSVAAQVSHTSRTEKQIMPMALLVLLSAQILPSLLG